MAACWALAWAQVAGSTSLASLADRLQGLRLHRALQADGQVSCPIGNHLSVGWTYAFGGAGLSTDAAWGQLRLVLRITGMPWLAGLYLGVHLSGCLWPHGRSCPVFGNLLLALPLVRGHTGEAPCWGVPGILFLGTAQLHVAIATQLSCRACITALLLDKAPWLPRPAGLIAVAMLTGC